MPSFSWLLVPFSVIELYALCLGISFLLGAFNVKFRDISSIWDVLTQALFYAVPIIYPLSMVSATSETFAKLLLLNPIAQVIQDVRHNLITTEAQTIWNYINNPLMQIIPIILVVIILIIAALYFRKRSKYFAEEV